MTAPLPDSWNDEPWPLDDPVPAPTVRPTNWSDTHDTVPQVADLADEAQELADRYGWSMERALVEAQRRHIGGSVTAWVGPAVSASVAGWVIPPSVLAAIRAAAEQMQQAQQAADEYEEAFEKVRELFATDFAALAADLRSMADEARKPKIRWCPQHGQMAAGGFCRRCGR